MEAAGAADDAVDQAQGALDLDQRRGPEEIVFPGAHSSLQIAGCHCT